MKAGRRGERRGSGSGVIGCQYHRFPAEGGPPSACPGADKGGPAAAGGEEETGGI